LVSLVCLFHNQIDRQYSSEHIYNILGIREI
jgi:hypothetical protein